MKTTIRNHATSKIITGVSRVWTGYKGPIRGTHQSESDILSNEEVREGLEEALWHCINIGIISRM